VGRGVAAAGKNQQGEQGMAAHGQDEIPLGGQSQQRRKDGKMEGRKGLLEGELLMTALSFRLSVYR
jgi:hypothetical protein